MMTTPQLKADLTEIKRALSLIVVPGNWTELRVPKTGKTGTVSGYFNSQNLDAMTQAAAMWNGKAGGIYVTLNPVNPALSARAENHAKPYAEYATADADILRRLWLLGDFDAVRLSGISSTDSEHEAALARAGQARDYLLSEGFSQNSIVLADSGNGGHLLIRIDLPNDTQATGLCQRALQALDLKFRDGAVAVDLTTYNAARISKVYGTYACKGDSTTERPHRIARLIMVPDSIVPVSRDLLEKLAATVPVKPTVVPMSATGHKIDLGAWLDRYGIKVHHSKQWQGGTLFVLSECPWDPEHNHGEAWAMQFDNGAIDAGCHHNGCSNYAWADLRSKYEPISRPVPAHGEPVDLAHLLNDVRAMIKRYVVLGSPQADAVTLWVAHTHAVDAAESTPYLAINSPEKRSGKTRLLEVLDLLVARPWLTGRTTPAALARKVDKDCPTLLLDESDAAFKGDKEYSETLRSILNTGHRRGGKVTVCVGQGANLDFGDFSTFSPKAIAGIGKLPDTVADRSIGIVLKRRAPTEPIGRFRHRDAALKAAPLRESLTQWASPAVPALRDARPDIPDALDDRAADGWEPLLAIADMAGGDWPQRARDAARVLSAGAAREDESIGVRLLADIRTAFKEAGTAKLFTADLLERLNSMEVSPWGGWQGGAFTGRTLGGILKRYGIGPKQVRIGDKTQKGYDKSLFEDAWVRYTPIYPKQGNTEAGDDASSFEPSETNPKMFPQDIIAAKEKARYDVSDVSDKHAVQGGNTTANGLEV